MSKKEDLRIKVMSDLMKENARLRVEWDKAMFLFVEAAEGANRINADLEDAVARIEKLETCLIEALKRVSPIQNCFQWYMDACALVRPKPPSAKS